MWISITEIDLNETLLNLNKIDSISKSALCNKECVITFSKPDGGVYYWKFDTKDECDNSYGHLKSYLTRRDK